MEGSTGDPATAYWEEAIVSAAEYGLTDFTSIMDMTYNEFKLILKGCQLKEVKENARMSNLAIMVAAAIGSAFSDSKQPLTAKDLYDEEEYRHRILTGETINETETKSMIERLGEDGLAQHREAKAKMDEKSRTVGWNPNRYSSMKKNKTE